MLFCPKNVQKASDSIYKVLSYGQAFIVDIVAKTCSCHRFQIDEIPCAHAYIYTGRLVAGISEDNKCGANWFNIFTNLSTIYISLIRTYFRLIQHYLPQLETEC
ncbi:zinc finger containing preotein [Striga asiatica]|uniref:Zinc finger containing preotein n=1 Tax=Striga asiatica TaxID=4170 RepID=A0A5A7QLT3_STRAF|nr:zinc finger containing preotein [Striga asiatica]